MIKWLRYETCKASPLYQLLAEKAAARLSERGHFAKVAVMEDANVGVLDDSSIRWDYLKRMIEETHDTELIPMASVFFKEGHSDGRKDKRHGREHPPERFPGRYIAHGYGKKTAGFCIATRSNSVFVVERLKLKRQKVRGVIKSGNQSLRIGRRARVEGLDSIGLIPTPPLIESKKPDAA